MRKFQTLILAVVLTTVFGSFNYQALADTSTTSGNRVLENPSSGGSIIFRVNDAGTKRDVMTYGSTGIYTFEKSTSANTGPLLYLKNPNTTQNTRGDLKWAFYSGTPSSTYQDAGMLRVENTRSGGWGASGTWDSTMEFYTSNGSSLGLAMTITNNGYVEPKLHTDALCGTGMLCSGTFTSTASSMSGNVVGTPSCTAGYFMRVGNVVTYGFRCSTQLTSGTITSSYRVNLPLTTTNFGGGDRAYGTCVTDVSTSGAAATVWYMSSVSGAQTALLELTSSSTTASRPVICTIVYKLE